MWPESHGGDLPVRAGATGGSMAQRPGPPLAADAMPRILHLITTLDRGGTEQMVLNLARAQRDLGCHVEVAVLKPPGAAAAGFAAAGLTVHALGLRRKLSPGAWWRLRRLLRRGGYDILHTHLDLADLYGPFAVSDGRPLVFSSRHNTDDWRMQPSWKRRPFLIWERAAQRRTAATLAVSAAVRDFLVEVERLDRARFAVVPNGIDLEPFSRLPPPAEARRELAGRLQAAGEPLPAALSTGRQPLALFCGRLSRQKGADLLLQALARCATDLSLVLLGEGPDLPALRAQARTLGLSGRVAFAGFQPDVASLLPAGDLLAMPSRWEGFGLAAVEAMAAGLPVVATACDGLKDVVEDGVTGRLVAAGDVQSLAAALDEVLGWPQRGARAGEAGRRRAQALFGAARMAGAVLEQYRRALAGEPPEGDGHDATSIPDSEDLATLVLADRQIRGMWRGILPPLLRRLPPAAHLRAQARDYRAVADEIERQQPLAGCRFLDLGCGLGTLVAEARRRGALAAGVEPEAASLALGRQRLGRAAPLAAAVGEALPFSDASVDVIACCSVLEHVADPAAVLAEAGRILKPGGLLYLGVPNALRFQERHYKVFLPPRLPRWLARLYLRLRRRDPGFLDSLHEMTPGRARRLAEGAGFEVISDPVSRGLARLEAVARGQRRPATARGRAMAALLSAGPGHRLVRALIGRGFFVDGALLARRPRPRGPR